MSGTVPSSRLFPISSDGRSQLVPKPSARHESTMSGIARYLTHPQVRMDPTVHVQLWSLNSVGRARTEATANRAWLSETRQIISSGERKAVETAEIIAN